MAYSILARLMLCLSCLFFFYDIVLVIIDGCLRSLMKAFCNTILCTEYGG